MNKKYYYKTIEECEKEILDKTIILDLIHSSNSNLFECFVRTVRTVMYWIMILMPTAVLIFKGFKPYIKLLIILLVIYIIGSLLMSWVKFKNNESYSNMKINLVDHIIVHCEEYNEENYEEWQKKQILKGFADIANIQVNWDKVK